MEQEIELQKLHEDPDEESADSGDRSQYKALRRSVTGTCDTGSQTEGSETEGNASLGTSTSGTVTVLKSMWYIAVLAFLNLIAAVVFMGIEGKTGKYANIGLSAKIYHSRD